MQITSKLITAIEALVDIAESEDNLYFDLVNTIALIFPSDLVESLQQLVNNPTYDGNVISKSYRDILLSMNLATRVCAKGEQGYTGARYIAWSVLKKIKENIKREK